MMWKRWNQNTTGDSCSLRIGAAKVLHVATALAGELRMAGQVGRAARRKNAYLFYCTAIIHAAATSRRQDKMKTCRILQQGLQTYVNYEAHTHLLARWPKGDNHGAIRCHRWRYGILSSVSKHTIDPNINVWNKNILLLLAKIHSLL